MNIKLAIIVYNCVHFRLSDCIQMEMSGKHEFKWSKQAEKIMKNFVSLAEEISIFQLH